MAWDGEAVRNEENPESLDHPYSLFGCSDGWRIRSYNLTTMDCLSLLLDAESSNPEAIHFGFAFGYDVNMVLRNLPLQALQRLRQFTKCRWNGIDIEYIPRKWLMVSYGRPGHRTTIKVFDVFSFFGKGLALVLKEYNIGTPEQIMRIEAGKGERPDFRFDSILGSVEPYWETELELMVLLMDKFREILESAGIFLSSWHGPGAIASYLMRQHNVKEIMDRKPSDEVLRAARYSYFGGRFEPFLVGFHEGPIYSADVNSAYPWSFSRLPSLSSGKWVHTLGRPDNPSDTRLGMYRIRYGAPFSNKCMPLPYRDKAGSVFFPPATEVWAHAAEASMVYSDPSAEFLESWIYEDDGSFPFEWIEDLYWKRLELQKNGDPTQIAFKLGPNSLYGQVARRTGWERTGKAPNSFQLEWAGAITSECRSLVLAAARSVGRGLISVDTDGILSLVPFKALPNGEGNRLGQWKCKEYTGMFYVQNGIYWLRDSDGNWLPPKTRGVPRKKLEFQRIFDIVDRGKEIAIEQHRFVGFGTALRGRIGEWRHWVDEPRSITFGGTGKRVHSSRNCRACRKGLGYTDGLHDLMLVPPKGTISYPHTLPWLGSESRTGNESMGGFPALGEPWSQSRTTLMDDERWGIFE